MTERILEALDAVETEEDVRIIYACESGSRAWGFPSSDSDYDVRFIYVHSPDWYLAIDEGRDVIERPIEEALDLSGWELRKALRLLRRSNAPLVEWLGSPIVYTQDEVLARRLRSLVPACFRPVAAFHHYLQMARRIHSDSLQGELVSAKKVLYALRPVLASRWIERGLGVVPTEFDRLKVAVLEEKAVRAAVECMIELKRDGRESDREERSSLILEFLDRELARLATVAPEPVNRNDPSPALNDLFRSAIRRE